MVKLGINIHPVIPVAPKNATLPWTDSRQPSAQEKVDLDRFLIESDADANLVMNDINNARRIAALVPRSKTIFRLYNKNVEGALWEAHTPATYVEGMKGYFDERLILNIGNEPDGKMPLDKLKRAVDFYTGVMHLLGTAKQEATLPAWGSGNPKLEWFTEDTSWSVIAPLFQAFKEYPTNSLNLHSYFNKHGLGYGSGHIGRHETIAEWVMKRLGFVPDMYFTEYGADLVAGIPGPWMQVFGENDIGETRYSEILTLGPVKAFPQSYVKGVMVYCWWAYPEWRLYDISKARLVQAAIIRLNHERVVIPPTPIYVPVPADLQGAETIMLQGAAKFPLQAIPTIDSKQNVGSLDNGDQVRIYRTSSTMADSLTFYWIERTSTPVGQSPYGWIVYHLLPPIIELPPPDTTAEGDIRRVAILTSQKESLQTEVRRLEQEIKSILSKYLPTLPETPQIAV